VQLARRAFRVTIVNDGPPAYDAFGSLSHAFHALPGVDWLRFDAEGEGNAIHAAYRYETSIGYDASASGGRRHCPRHAGPLYVCHHEAGGDLQSRRGWT